ASQQDCLGGTTICGSQGINNNSNNTGDVEDLNLANQGCLTAGERQGTWYYFSPSSSGTVGFTINPSVNTNDYDFAVWGPMTTVDCPPSGPPVRCSFSALTGNTGLGNGAVDLSEGAGGDKWVSTLNVLVGQVYILYVDNFSTSGQAFNLNWNLSNGASLDCTLLPIQITAFDAQAHDEVVDVNWSTGNSSDVVLYQVQRSVDASHFTSIGTVMNSEDLQAPDHAWTDESPLTGLSYYRLVLITENGSAAPTHAVPVLRGLTVNAPFPNPAGNELWWVPPTMASGSRIRISDPVGRILASAPAPTSGTVHITLADLPAGIYTVFGEGPDGQRTAAYRFLKQ
ncbi:MAG: T9SS type A sorting domain-containing protein, partial [Flavobacteriales bacterium]|nr:T9SS type A sorting domain-containing protein [Flavobacteriales bacterium]